MKKHIIFILVALIVFTSAGCSNENKQADNIPKLISETPLPDVELGEERKGFTCTGLAYDSKENVFWMGNFGKSLPEDKSINSTIVKVTKDGTTNLEEIKLYEVSPSMTELQGVTIDSSDDTIWLCIFSENKIRHISKTGTDISSIDINKPTGIAYDKRTDTLWVLTFSELMNISKDGKIIESIDVEIEGQDQLFLDEDNNTMYFTAGINYKGDNFVYKIDLSTKEMNLEYTLKDSFAVEGIYIEGEIMYILNDGYYHEGKVNVNQINKYDISKVMTYKEFKESK